MCIRDRVRRDERRPTAGGHHLAEQRPGADDVGHCAVGLGTVMLTDEGRHVAPSEDRRLASGALRSAGQPQRGIRRHERRPRPHKSFPPIQIPRPTQQAGQVRQARRGEWVLGRVRPAQPHTVQEEEMDKGSIRRCQEVGHG